MRPAGYFIYIRDPQAGDEPAAPECDGCGDKLSDEAPRRQFRCRSKTLGTFCIHCLSKIASSITSEIVMAFAVAEEKVRVMRRRKSRAR